eukprot:scaffold8470_cov61-Skeletonema_marinoi.AAC.1
MECTRGSFNRAAGISLQAEEALHHVGACVWSKFEVVSDPDLLPCYEYFAQGIQRHTSLETFKIINYHLPPSSWLENSILPSLEKKRAVT